MHSNYTVSCFVLYQASLRTPNKSFIAVNLNNIIVSAYKYLTGNFCKRQVYAMRFSQVTVNSRPEKIRYTCVAAATKRQSNFREQHMDVKNKQIYLQSGNFATCVGEEAVIALSQAKICLGNFASIKKFPLYNDCIRYTLKRYIGNMNWHTHFFPSSLGIILLCPFSSLFLSLIPSLSSYVT